MEESGIRKAFEGRTVYKSPTERVVGSEMNTQHLALRLWHLTVEQRASYHRRI